MKKRMDQAVKETEGGFTQEDVLEYLRLLDRRIFIVMHSGIDWQPEYEQELVEIDQKLAALRVHIAAAHAAREAANLKALAKAACKARRAQA